MVEGTQALLALLADERLGAGETLVTAMVQNVEQTQAQNNPYGSLEEREHPDLYRTFEYNWYEGYTAGFLVKTALGGAGANAAKNTIKSTKTAQNVASKLESTKVTRALSRVSDAKDAAKARATARILLATDGDAAEAMLSQADTAGGAYKLWRHQRAMDADVDALPEAKQERLGRLLLRTGDDGARFVDALDQDTLDGFLSIRRTAAPDGGSDISDLTRTVLVRESRDLSDAEINQRVQRVSQTYEGLKPGAKERLARAIEDSGEDGIYMAERVSADRLQTLVDDGVDLTRHAEGLGVYRRSGKSVNRVGDIGEIVAHDTVVRKHVQNNRDVFPPSNSYVLYPKGEGKGITLKAANEIGDVGKHEEIGEFDHLITNADGDVVATYQTKVPNDKAMSAAAQNDDAIDNIHTYGLSAKSSYKFEQSQFDGDIATFTIGPKDGAGYDLRMDFSDKELRSLFETIDSEGL